MRRGFTLIELLIVIAIIGILAAGIISIINPMAQFQKANDAKRKSDLSQIQRALETYYQDHGFYPAAVSFMIMNTNGDGPANWGTAQWTPYMSTLPIDPSSSKKNYVYNSTPNGQAYCIYASLDREVQITNPGTCFPSGASCGTGYSCNYGISSPNVSP